MKHNAKIEQLLKILVSPDNNELALHFNSETKCLETATGLQYNVVNEIPILIPVKNHAEISAEAQVHKKLDTKFNYAEHYEADAKHFDYFTEFSGAFRNELQRLHQTIINNISAQNITILDVGCGNAWLANHFCNKNNKVVSMDISTVNPLKALQKVPSDNHFAVTADVFHLPFKREAFDYIVASEILEHVTNPKLFVENLINILKPKGKLIITTPYNEKLKFELCVHCNRPTPHNAHIHSFTEKDFAFLCPTNAKILKIDVFMNKILVKLRTHFFTKYFSFFIWKTWDKFFNFFIKKQSRILVIYQKE